MTTYRFTEVYRRAQDGLPKSYTEVRADVDAEYEAWRSLPVLCAACAQQATA